MAAITASAANNNGSYEAHTYTWTLTEADTAVRVTAGENADRTVQIAGTFGGATVVVQGSLDDTNYLPLHDMAGNALSFTAAGIASIAEATPYLKVVATGGAAQSVKAMIFARRK